MLLWALGRARRRERRLVRWSEAHGELTDLLSRFGGRDDRPTPEYPFLALAGTGWWELAGARGAPPAHGSLPRRWLRDNNPSGGLAMGVNLRMADDDAERDRVVQALLDRFFTGEPTGALLAAVGLEPVGAAKPTRRLDWTRDELILACDLLAANGWHELPDTDARVIELSNLLRTLPIYPVDRRAPTFRSPGSVRRKMTDIATRHPDSTRQPTNGNRLDRQVLDEFLAQPEVMHQSAEALRVAARSHGFDALPPVVLDDDGVPEGRLLARRHYVRERDPKLRRKKLDEAFARHGCVACEVCGFDFEATYGSRGARYAECHHVVPLHASGATTTRLADLAILCANCHRMIHRSDPWLTPDQLRSLVQAHATT